MARRNVVQREQLSESSELAWHAYAVEYGLRVRTLGLRVCAVDIPLTHHSLTRKAALDAPYMPLRRPTPPPCRCARLAGSSARLPACGVVPPPLGAHRWRYRWLRNSVAAHAGRKAAGGGSCVLSDIRFDIDDVLSARSELSAPGCESRW